MYHFIGIKGSGMSALAVIFKNLGYDVKGSDIEKHLFTEKELIRNDILVTAYNENNIYPGLKIIKGSSITDDNIELKKAHTLNLEVNSYEDILGGLTKKFKTICIAGCHGKTTTTAMCSHVLNNTIGANYLIGDGTGYASRENDYFVLESCEYKRHFLKYHPYYAVILNIDLDHVDYFKDINDVIDAYQEFVNKASVVIACGDDENIVNMHLNNKCVYFGINDNNDVKAKNIIYAKDYTGFDVFIKNKLYGHFDLPIFGKHQLLDALAVISVCYCENINIKDIIKYLKTFKGARRRFSETVVGNNIIIDDYAHHPNEVKATINAIKQKYPDKKIIAVFEPHTFSRTKKFTNDLVEEFKRVDEAYIMDIHPAREKQNDYLGINKNLIIDKLPNGHVINLDEAYKLDIHDNSVFIFMSPNDISELEKDLIKLKNKKL